MKIKVKGEDWTVSFRLIRDDAMGWCIYDDQKILVDKRLEGETRLDVLIHELLHAHHPQLSEESVTQTATEIARVLWRLGYRGVDEV